MADQKHTGSHSSKGGGSGSDAFAVQAIFPPEQLDVLKVSPLVRSFTPDDFADMAKAFSVPPQPQNNPKVKKLTTQDLFAIDSLFQNYRSEVIANFQGVEKVASVSRFHGESAAGTSCCCCCTPCCSCSAAAQHDPFTN